MDEPIILTLNLIEDSILLNEGVLNALDWPRQVQLMINQDAKMLLLRACTMEDKQAVVIPADHVEQFEISGRALLKKIRRIVGWNDDIPRICYGEYLPAHQAIRFDLEDAEPIDMTDKGIGGYEWTENNSSGI